VRIKDDLIQYGSSKQWKVYINSSNQVAVLDTSVNCFNINLFYLKTGLISTWKRAICGTKSF